MNLSLFVGIKKQGNKLGMKLKRMPVYLWVNYIEILSD